MKYEITVTRYGFTTIEAETKEEAETIANEMATDDFEWSMDVIVTDCQEEDVY